MGHNWRNVMVPELIHWTGVPIWHGALDGKPGTTFSRWNAHDPCYDNAIANIMTIEHWKSIKRFFKLNNNLLSKPHGMEGYDPCVKYLYLQGSRPQYELPNPACQLRWNDRRNNMGFWRYGGEAVGRLMNKKVTKGGQSTMFYDIH